MLEEGDVSTTPEFERTVIGNSINKKVKIALI